MVFDDIVRLAVEYNCSDIHLIAGLPPTFRRHGEITVLEEVANVKTSQLVYSMLNSEQTMKIEKGIDLDFAMNVAGNRIRVNVFKQQGQVSAVLRILNNKVLSLEELNLPEILKNICMFKHGLVLVTGPTGSGKSTTLASMINYINLKKKGHIVTIEDPVEYIHKPKNCIISQREVGNDVNSFQLALKSVLRQDPDVILLGEMRDHETISAAITAAETGHLVFATLHTLGASETVDRMIDVFPSGQQNQIRAQLASCLKAVITQQLIMRADGKGRIGAFEILVINDAVQSMIRDNKTHMISSTMQTGMKAGMQTMDACLAEYVKRGIIERETAAANCFSKDNLKRMLI